MNKGVKVALWILGFLLIIGIVYYVFIYLPQQKNKKLGTNSNGGTGTKTHTSLTSVPGCTDHSATNFNPSATINNGSCVGGVGSDVHLKTEAELGGSYPTGNPSGIPVYSQPLADSPGTYLLGVTRDFLGGSKIGKVVENRKTSADGSPGTWTKVHLENWDTNQLKIWIYNSGNPGIDATCVQQGGSLISCNVPHGYSSVTKKITGDVWIHTSDIKTFKTV